MKKKLIIYNIIVTVIVLLLMFGAGLIVTNGNYEDMTERKIKEITGIYAANYAEDMSFPASTRDVRVTVVDATGKVIADSMQADVSGMENHIDRQEIVAALADSPQVVIRKSDTLDKQMMYYAEKVVSGDSYVFIRVAVPIESIDSYALQSLVPMLVILIAVWAVSTVASVFLSGVFLKPLKQVKDALKGIENGTYNKISPTTDDSDINSILSGINDLGERLRENIVAARDGKQKLDYVLNNVTDGIAVFDRSLNVMIANPRISEIFGVRDAAGKHIEVLTVDEVFVSAIRECADNRTGAIFQFEAENRWYLCTVNFTDSDLIIAVLCDITYTKNGEKMRLEFFANASHELKTPLTAVKGFNDLISMRSEDGTILEYSGKINKELDRVLNLIDDMLNLSKLENTSAAACQASEVSLGDVAREVRENLDMLAAEKKVKVNISGDAKVFAEREHIYELIKNLAENGIRYNNEGGEVKISLKDKKSSSELVVSDNGIGIDAAYQSRIFERFYRVDKSRSRATGGTGLGLAIVKHVCELYGAKLSLSSKLGAGTVVKVEFSK